MGDGDGLVPPSTATGHPAASTSKSKPTAGIPKGDSPANVPNALTPSRYLAWLYSTDAQKPVLAALLEIEAEIVSGLRPGVEHHVAHARLQWWSEEAERCAQGRPVHPLVRELVKAHAGADTGGHAGVGTGGHAGVGMGGHAGVGTGGHAGNAVAPPTGIGGLVDTAVWDLASATFETRKELTAYCERWAAAMFETAAGVVVRDGRPATVAHIAVANAQDAVGTAAGAVVRDGRPEAVAYIAAANAQDAVGTAAGPIAPSGRPAAAQLAADTANAADTADTAATAAALSRWKTLGAAVREVELLTDLARDGHIGRIRIPLDELDRAGVDANSLAKLPWPAPLTALLRERHEALRVTIASSVAALAPDEQMALRGLLVWVALTWRLSVRAQRALPSVILPRRYDALADGWQAWRAAPHATPLREDFD